MFEFDFCFLNRLLDYLFKRKHKKRITIAICYDLEFVMSLNVCAMK